MNLSKQRLMIKLQVLGLSKEHMGYSQPLPLVSLEDFFEGNDDPESIAVNLLASDPAQNRHPGLEHIYSTLKDIRSRPDVQDVLVEIFEIETVLQNAAKWPFAEKVFFYTSVPRSEIEQWNTALSADGPVEASETDRHPNEPTLKTNYKSWYVIWD